MTDRAIVQRLTDCVWVGLDYPKRCTNRPCRVFSALKTGVKVLHWYYEGLSPKDIKGQSLADSRFFPWVTTYRGVGGPLEFEYLGYLENVPDCVTMRARIKSGQNIVVRFVDRYGERVRAYRLLAQEGLALELIYHGSLNTEQEYAQGHSPQAD
jgi:hypothetical protein